MDFMHDNLSSGKKYRLLNIIDDYNREGLGVRLTFHYHHIELKKTLKRLINQKG